jgi:hypothetical protein
MTNSKGESPYRSRLSCEHMLEVSGLKGLATKLLLFETRCSSQTCLLLGWVQLGHSS